MKILSVNIYFTEVSVDKTLYPQKHCVRACEANRSCCVCTGYESMKLFMRFAFESRMSQKKRHHSL